ncbi:MAG: hypothetical protein A9183_00745 [Dehalococcoides mccartyi]|uniref:hypothetical protein n=1 Tax=Dehalococcoides mccartyi TaxID=61435 RepID=UPI000804E1E7|nr:hypothetical protein [Dehalococcoides mccartyi]OBW62936.1 MAG: hypothetical protein A9183_00745 [Dehalococcoides mccartyi]
MGWKTFNDRIALVLVLLIPVLWIVNTWIQMPGEVLGATIASWTLVLQYYFRKKPDTGGSK